MDFEDFLCKHIFVIQINNNLLSTSYMQDETHAKIHYYYINRCFSQNLFKIL